MRWAELLASLTRTLYGAVALFGLLLLFVTFTPVVKEAASKMQQDWYDGDADVLIVLGGAMLAPGTGPTATIGQDTYVRCVYAAWAYSTHHYQYVLVTGNNGLAQGMTAFLTCHGVPRERILQERAATSTYENATYSRRILDHVYGMSRMPQTVVLTSDYHSWRALHTFAHIGFRLHVIGVPDVIKRSSRLRYRWEGFLILAEETAKIGYYWVSGKL